MEIDNKQIFSHFLLVFHLYSNRGSFAPMLLKWAVCSVAEEQLSLFSIAQKKWEALKGVQGFLGQIGGWTRDTPPYACMLSLWQDEASYWDFMQHQDEIIFPHNKQNELFSSPSTTLCTEIMAIPGSMQNFISALSACNMLRVTASQTFPERTQDFIQNQIKIWNPGMAEARGMYSAIVARTDEHPPRFLLTSLWQDRQAHQAYLATLFPLIRKYAQLPQTVQQIKGWFVQLEKEWQVIL